MVKLNKVIIREPIWNGRALGVAGLQWAKGDIILGCSYKTIDNKKLLKNKYQVSRQWAQQFKGIMCGPYPGYAIPIEQLLQLKPYIKPVKVVQPRLTKEEWQVIHAAEMKRYEKEK